MTVAETKKKRRNADVQIAETEKKRRSAGAAPKKLDDEAEEYDLPLKRLRLRYRENQVSTSSGLSNPRLAVNSKHLQLQNVDNSHDLIRPKDVRIIKTDPASNGIGQSPQLDDEAEEYNLPLKRLRLSYRENQVSTSSVISNPRSAVNSKHLQLQNVDNSHDLIRPKDVRVIKKDPGSNGIGQNPQLANHFRVKRCDVNKDNEQKAMNANSYNGMVVEHHEMMPLEAKPYYFVKNISKGLESVVISLINEVNNDPPPAFRYIPSNLIYEKADVGFSLARIGDCCCSTCIGDCVSNPCACAHATKGVVYTSGGLVKDGFLEECISMNRHSRIQSLFYCKDCHLERSRQEKAKEGCKGHFVRKFIKECWWKCGCNGQCGNRVVQRGIKRSLQVFMDPKGKGWGLRTLEDLPRGAFVCEFVGEILTTKELFKRISEIPSKHEFPVLLDADWSTRVIKDEEALCLDAVYYGNIARFINHRCFDANLIGIPVEVDTPERHYYRFAFFTTRKVDALEELTRDYGINFDDHGNQFKTFECLCQSKFCQNLRRMTRSRSAKKRG